MSPDDTRASTVQLLIERLILKIPFTGRYRNAPQSGLVCEHGEQTSQLRDALNTRGLGRCCCVRKETLDLLQTSAEENLSWPYAEAPGTSGCRRLSCLYFLIKAGVRQSQLGLWRTLTALNAALPGSYLFG